MKGIGMGDSSIGAILLGPVFRSPSVLVEVADTGVVGSYPVIGRQLLVEDVVHVLLQDHVGIEVADLVVVVKFV